MHETIWNQIKRNNNFENLTLSVGRLPRKLRPKKWSHSQVVLPAAVFLRNMKGFLLDAEKAFRGRFCKMSRAHFNVPTTTPSKSGQWKRVIFYDEKVSRMPHGVHEEMQWKYISERARTLFKCSSLVRRKFACLNETLTSIRSSVSNNEVTYPFLAAEFSYSCS